MPPTDWFSSDQLLADLFARLQGEARVAAAGAVAAAANAAREQLPALGAAARAELNAAIRDARVQLNQTITVESAHAIRILADNQPQLREQVNGIAAAAGVVAGRSLSDEALNNANRRSAALRPYVIAGGVVLAVLATGIALILAQQAAQHEADRLQLARRT